MDTKPTYKELEQRIAKLEAQTLIYKELDLAPIFKGIEKSFPMGIADHNRIMIYVNDPLVKMWGYSSDKEIIGRRLPEFWEGDSIFSTIDDLINTGWSMGEDIGKRKDGSLFNAEYVAIMCKDNNGEPLYMLGQFFDITERKRAEEALQESEERYKSLFKNNHSVMLLIDPENADIVDANPAAISYYGWSHDEIICKKITNINTLPEDQVFQEMEHARKEQGRHFYFRHCLANGDIRDVEVCSGPIKLHGKQFLYSIIHDITERKKTEEERDQLIKDLQEASKEINTLRGILPFCSFCKKIRDDKGYWEKVDVYLNKYSQADISHSVCPECAKKHYPDLEVYED